MFTKMLIPLDGSKTAEQVLPFARSFTSRFHKPIELIAALDIGEILAYVSTEKTRAAVKLIEAGELNSEAYLKAVAARLEGAQVHCTVAKGRAEEVIIERGEADPGMLIAMATHGRSGLNRWLLGSVAEKVLRGTANPLLLIRAKENGRCDGEAALRSLIVPLDGSPMAESVLPMVAGIANRLELNVELFRAYNVPYSLYGFGHGYYAVDIQQYMAEIRDDMRNYLEGKVAEVRALGVDKVSYVASEGLSADEIIRLGRGTPETLIAMCSHGRSGIKRWALGSVTETVVRHCDKPMLILRPAVHDNG